MVERFGSQRIGEGSLKTVIIGRLEGRYIMFWEDDLVGSEVLKNRFPRLFSLFDKMLSDCGVWFNNVC